MLAAPVGEFGVVYAPMDYPQPWFDDHEARVYPVYHVLRGLGAGAGRAQLSTALSNGSAVQAVAWRANAGAVIWLANLTPEAQTVALKACRRGAAGSRCSTRRASSPRPPIQTRSPGSRAPANSPGSSSGPTL